MTNADGSEKLRKEFYLEYLTKWIEATDAHYIMFDTYPFRDNGIQRYHTDGLKYTAEFCKEKNLEFWVVAQSASWGYKGVESVANRAQIKEDMYWQLNMLMGFGVSKIMYYTYFRRAGCNSTTGGYYHDNASFVNSNGEKTPLYYYVKDIMSEMQKFADTILDFKYQGSAIYTQNPTFSDSHRYCLDGNKNDTFTKIKNVVIGDGNMAMVNELYNDEQQRYIYMVLNALDPANVGKGDTTLSAEVEFDEKYSRVAVYYKGEVCYEELDGHKYSCKLIPGDAVFLIPC
jgi:hypothetical protein